MPGLGRRAKRDRPRPAGLARVGAAVGEVAPGHGADERRHDAGNGSEVRAAAGLPGDRDALEEPPGVRVRGGPEDLARGALLDDLPRVHDRHPVAEPGDHPEVVGNQDEPRLELALKVGEQVEDLRLDGDVEGGGRLVRDDEVGLAHEGHRDHHPLAEAAGELVRVLPQPPLRPRDPDLLQQPHRPVTGRRRACPPVPPLRFDELVADGVGGVQRRHRLLEDHAHPVSPDVGHLSLREPEEILAVEREPPRASLRARGQEVHERERGQRLAATRFADDGEGAAPLDPEADLLHRVQHPGRHRDLDAQLLDREDGSGHRFA